MRPDDEKDKYRIKLENLLTYALGHASVRGVEVSKVGNNFQPFTRANGLKGAFISAEMWIEENAGYNEGMDYGKSLTEICMLVVRGYYFHGVCQFCKSDLAHNAHHWGDCIYEVLKRHLEPTFPNTWRMAEEKHKA